MISRLGRFYALLLVVCLAVLVCFALPPPWSGLTSIGYLLLGLVLILGLGRQNRGPAGSVSASGRAYGVLGITAIGFWLLWTLTPSELRTTGIPVVVLWTVFSGWSAIRLISLLAGEKRVNAAVLQGALAGYLMLGIFAGLLLCALETIDPGSFRGTGLSEALHDTATPVWGVNFVKLNYFAFVSLTTMGYGDVVPQSAPAQMVSVVIAIAGTFYVAAVMGLLISRLTVQESRE
ncbi:ion channel [Cyanobium sp. FGCU-6]|nr:ion channel [Cyanobium sp. FGCU6]